MWDALIQFWNNNSSNIIVSLLVGFVFFVFGPLGLWFSGKKIRRERIRKAKEVLIDLLEGMVVNQANLDETRLRSVFSAVERDVDTDLSGEYHIEHWLSDVVLRFEKSRHLSADQKQQYYNAISKITYEPLFNDLKSALASSKNDKAVEVVEELEREIIMRERTHDPLLNVLRVYGRMYARSPLTFSVAIIISVVLYVVLLAKFLPHSPF